MEYHFTYGHISTKIVSLLCAWKYIVLCVPVNSGIYLCICVFLCMRARVHHILSLGRVPSLLPQQTNISFARTVVSPSRKILYSSA